VCFTSYIFTQNSFFHRGNFLSSVIRISDDDVSAMMSPADFVASCDAAFQLYGKGEMVNPAREESLTREDDVEVFHLTLPGEWKGKYRGRKIIEEHSDIKTGRLGERTAFIELEDWGGAQRVVLDAEHITNMRTGAAGVLGAKYMCQLPIQKVAILGTGRIAMALARCADVALHPEEIWATSRKAENRRQFANDLDGVLSCKLQMFETIETCVRNADVILAAVPTPTPVLKKGMVTEKVHISVLGGDQRTQQLEQALFLNRQVIPDHSEQVLKSGDFLTAKASGRCISYVKDGTGEIMDVGQAALGTIENLRGQGAIVYFSGMAIQDVHAASVVWERHQSQVG
jgi:alanine dehydrogenase